MSLITHDGKIVTVNGKGLTFDQLRALLDTANGSESVTLAEAVENTEQAKTDIASAITAKGGTVGAGDGLADFPAAIAAIPSGGAPVDLTALISDSEHWLPGYPDNNGADYNPAPSNETEGVCSHFLPVEAGHTYRLAFTDPTLTFSTWLYAYRFSNRMVAYNDGNKRASGYISRLAMARSADTKSVTFTVPDGTHYVLITMAGFSSAGVLNTEKIEALTMTDISGIPNPT